MCVRVCVCVCGLLSLVFAQVAKIFAPDPSSLEGEGEGGAGGRGGAPRKKSSMALNTLATKFKGSLTTLM